MAETSVKQLADQVGIEVSRLLKQIEDAGLRQRTANESIGEEEKKRLLSYLNAAHGDASQPKRITLTRKVLDSTVKVGAGKAGKAVAVEVRKKRVYERRDEPVVGQAATATPTGASAADTAEPDNALAREAERNRREEQARREAEEQERLDAERREQELRRADEERKRLEELARLEEQTRKAHAEAEAKKAQAAQQAAPAAEQKRPDARRPDRGDHRSKSGGKERGRGGDEELDDGPPRRREAASFSRDRNPNRRKKDVRVAGETGAFERPAEFIAREIELPEAITVGELASRMSVKAGELIKKLMGMGLMATINQPIDQDTAVIVVEEMGHKPKIVSSNAVEQELKKKRIDEEEKGEKEPRPPVVTVMGHVDHGKTSLLDYIRKTKVVASEAGGITQHIGAYHVATSRGGISFIDTPGHAAFTAMRARGAKVTDIVILVVAADDGVMPQTEEAIQHARAAEVPMVVAVNKVDKAGIDLDRVRNELAQKGVIPDDWGGDTQFVNVSALTGQGVDDLLEAVSLQAELLELKAVKDAPARGVVVESRLDRGRGSVATLLVKSGTLHKGDIVVAGQHYGRVRAMLSESNDQIEDAGPSIPVEVLGLGGTPDAGDEFEVVEDERSARELAALRLEWLAEQRSLSQQAGKLENLFANAREGEKPTLNIFLKADVRGSLEALLHAIGEMKHQEVRVNVVGSGVGGISESDANLAVTSRAVLFGFNVRADSSAKKIIEREGLDLRYYSIIYEMLDDIKQVLSGMLAPEVREDIVGVAEVRAVFRSPKFGQVAGCMVTEGIIYRNKKIRVLRDNVVIYEGELESLRRFKDDVAEVRNGFECGIGVRNYNDVREGDKIEVYDVRQVARTL